MSKIGQTMTRYTIDSYKLSEKLDWTSEEHLVSGKKPFTDIRITMIGEKRQ